MNINLTELSNYISLTLWIVGVILGPIIVNKIAKRKVTHILRSTINAFFLSLLCTPVLIQMYLLLKKEELSENQDI